MGGIFFAIIFLLIFVCHPDIETNFSNTHFVI